MTCPEAFPPTGMVRRTSPSAALRGFAVPIGSLLPRGFPRFRLRAKKDKGAAAPGLKHALCGSSDHVLSEASRSLPAAGIIAC